jgi:hypothetical protein
LKSHGRDIVYNEPVTEIGGMDLNFPDDDVKTEIGDNEFSFSYPTNKNSSKKYPTKKLHKTS